MLAINRKLVRDLKKLWAQALAIALVMACGVATLILSTGAYKSLDETRTAYYERYRFADLFASATRAPRHVTRRIEGIDGVLAAQPQVVQRAILDIPDMLEPASAFVLSLPLVGQPRLNRLYIKSGRLPEPGSLSEIAVSAKFAKAHNMSAGDTFTAVINGRRRELTVAALVLSPEYIYAIGPGDMVPDNRRFAIIWMRESALEAIADLEGAFNFISIALSRGANEASVIAEMDNILKPFGSTGTYGRKDQQSHAFLDSELTQLDAMARVIPPIFLAVSAFLINMILGRLIALEREQIGLLKAIGYNHWVIAWHYLKIGLAISIVGIMIGFAAGTFLGTGLTRLYANFFSFPFLLFVRSPDIYIIAALVCLAAALTGAVKAVLSVVRLPAAVAMKPPAPASFRRSVVAKLGLTRYFSRLTIMALRNVVRWPVRTGVTMLGTALAVSILILALFASGSINFMIDTVFFQSERQQATLTFAEQQAPGILTAVANLPAIMRAEPFRSEAVKISNGHLSRRLVIIGKSPRAFLSRILDQNLKSFIVPESGLVVSERVAHILKLQVGDTARVDFLQTGKLARIVPVTGIANSYIGLSVFMNLEDLHRRAGTGPRISGAYVLADNNNLAELYQAVKSTPNLDGIALLRKSREKFRETVEQNIMIMTTVYLILAVIIAFGVIYNSTRIQLSERARELASLRVLGFTRMEVSRVLLLELVVVVLAAQPLGWLLGYGFANIVIKGFENDMFRLPLVIEPDSYAKASLVVFGSAAISALIVLVRINRLNIIRALKIRE